MCVKCFAFSLIGYAILGCPATLEMNIIHNSSTTTEELIIIQLHVEPLVGVAVEEQDTQEGN